MNARAWRRLHICLTLVWLALIPPTVIVWQITALWVVLMFAGWTLAFTVPPRDCHG